MAFFVKSMRVFYMGIKQFVNDFWRKLLNGWQIFVLPKEKCSRPARKARREHFSLGKRKQIRGWGRWWMTVGRNDWYCLAGPF
jgi:hypothetical protein